MIWTDINKIPYQYIYDAVFSVSKKHKIESVRMDSYGEVYIKIAGKLEEKDRNFIMDKLVKGIGIKPDYYNDWEYSEDGASTYIYSPNGLDYRTIMDILEERTYHRISDIPYTFLRNALLSLVNDYIITSITISEDWGLMMDVMGHLTQEQIKDICHRLCPQYLDFNEVFKDMDSVYENYKETNVDYTTIAISKVINYTKL